MSGTIQYLTMYTCALSEVLECSVFYLVTNNPGDVSAVVHVRYRMMYRMRSDAT
jgi:hypothetical protein